jgi:hypothetical protein
MNAIKVQPTKANVEMKFPSQEFAMQKAFVGADLELNAASDESVWADERPNILSAYNELIQLLENKAK